MHPSRNPSPSASQTSSAYGRRATRNDAAAGEGDCERPVPASTVYCATCHTSKRRDTRCPKCRTWAGEIEPDTFACMPKTAEEGAAAVRALCPACEGVAFDGWDDGAADVTACRDCGAEGRIENGAFVLDDPPRPSRAWERFEARWAEAHGK